MVYRKALLTAYDEENFMDRPTMLTFLAAEVRTSFSKEVAQ